VEQVTQQALIHFAALTFFIVGVYFLIALWPKPPKPVLMPLDREKTEYFFLKNKIKNCRNEKDLNWCESLIDVFFDKHYNSCDNKELQQYYTFLLRAISEKREEINSIDQVTV
jgi:hypothetical protein